MEIFGFGGFVFLRGLVSLLLSSNLTPPEHIWRSVVLEGRDLKEIFREKVARTKNSFMSLLLGGYDSWRSELFPRLFLKC